MCPGGGSNEGSERKGHGQGFFFFLLSIIKPKCSEDKGILIPSAIDIFCIKTEGSKSFVYSFCIVQTGQCEMNRWQNKMIRDAMEVFFFPLDIVNREYSKYCGLPT